LEGESRAQIRDYKAWANGACAAGNRAGDAVCLLFGVQVPFIVREKAQTEITAPEGKLWELVGEAYVHGIMDEEEMAGARGEAFVMV
jgi:hypothetical protein